MKGSNTAKWAGAGAVAVLLSVSASGQTANYKPPVPAGFERQDADEVKTGTIYGDANKPGIYVTRNLFRKGAGGGQCGGGSRPHLHDQDRFVTVISGTWFVALGDEAKVYTPEKMTAMKPGSFVVHPANGVHYDCAKDEDVIVQIIGMGPVKTIQIPQAGDPPPGTPRGGRAGAGGAAAAPAPGR